VELSQKEIDLFRHNGFIRLPTDVPESQVEALKAAALKDIAGEVEPISRSATGQAQRLSELWDRGGVFRETIQSDEILDPLASLLGPNIEFQLNRHNHFYLREKGSTASLEVHRDVRQWSRTIVTVLIYLETTNLENGCTRLVPGSHLLPSFSDRGDKETLRVVMSQAVPVPMMAGGMIAMDGMTLHAAGDNQTDQTRMSMTLGYHSVDEFSHSVGERRVVVRGEREYRGNDRGRTSPPS
jgi:ectoine hydroxylase-related dioxygenase (phytanoyl-CoA dioxygenase family)